MLRDWELRRASAQATGWTASSEGEGSVLLILLCLPVSGSNKAGGALGWQSGNLRCAHDCANPRSEGEVRSWTSTSVLPLLESFTSELRVRVWREGRGLVRTIECRALVPKEPLRTFATRPGSALLLLAQVSASFVGASGTLLGW